MKVLLLISLFFTQMAMAEIGRDILPCTAQDMKELDSSMRDLTAKGFNSSYYLQNLKGEIIGLYSWKKEQAVARTCEVFFKEGVTVAHIWDFWENRDVSTDPATWAAGMELGIDQDNGMADFHVLKADSEGKVKVEFLVWGFGPSSDVLIKREILTFRKAL